MGHFRRVKVCCVLVMLVCCVTYPLASAFEASGQGESTYEEYDDESPYQGGYEMVEDLDSSPEDFTADHEDVLDPITDDDISYSGYEYEDPLDDHGIVGGDGGEDSSISSTLITPSTTEEFVQRHQMTAAGNGTVSALEVGTLPSSTLVVLEDGLSTPLPVDRVIGSMSSSVSPPPSPTMEENDNTCRDREKLPTQPTYVSREVSVIRKCCPQGESFMSEHGKYVSCQKNAAAPNTSVPQAIVAQFYRDCIEDLEEDIQLEVRYGSPCPTEGGMVSFGQRSNDTLYVIQNGSLLVIYAGIDYDVYDTYCLDYDRDDGSLVGYVCPSAVQVMPDLVQGQLFLLTVCLIVAIPGLLVTALFYIVVPKLHDLHGRALAMNCVNFAIALLLECFFQYRNRGMRMLMDDMVLENYAEYFILATFFWLLVNCANNCFHAWYYVPKAKKENRAEEYKRFAVYFAFAQLIPLWIILCYSMTPAGTPAIKHYLFIPIGVTLGLGLLSLLITIYGLTQLICCYYDRHEIRQRLLLEGRYEELCHYEPVCGSKVNKVIYMSKYTVPLFVVMGIIWTVMAVTYYATYELPIFYDILFGFQGILIFVIFVCMPRPYEAIKEWLVERKYCGWMCPGEVPIVEQPIVAVEAPMMRRAVPMQTAVRGCIPNPSQYEAYMAGPVRLKRTKNPFAYVKKF